MQIKVVTNDHDVLIDRTGGGGGGGGIKKLIDLLEISFEMQEQIIV